MIIITNIILCLCETIAINVVPSFLRIILVIIFFTIFLGKFTNIKLETAFIICIFSLAISYITLFISMVINTSIAVSVKKFVNLGLLHVISTAFLNIFFTIQLFKIRRFKDGFSFLTNEFVGFVITIIATDIVFLYLIGRSYKTFPIKDITYMFFILAVITFIIIQKAFILYQKQKLQTKALKDAEKELEQTKQKLQTALEEKEKIIKSNHEFYHRQEALKNKLNILANSSFNYETSEEISAITNRINNLTNEYNNKIHILPKLTLTEIAEIDDMLSYFQKECFENNIEFIFKLDCNINKIIDNLISKNELETLLGDLLRNAIIAINHSNNKYRSIMIVLGIKENYYELDIFDSGIPFELNTLLNLGIQKCSTHLNEGGTGIGFITTFETLQNTKSSIIITEMDSEIYSKCIGIRFDKKNKYIIDSNRINLLEKENTNNREIILTNSSKKTEL